MEPFEDLTVYLLPEQDQLDVIRDIPDSSEKGVMVLIQEKDDSVENLDLLAKILQAAGFEPEKELKLIRIKEGQQFGINQVLKSAEKSPILAFGDFDQSISTQFHKLKYKWLTFDDCFMLFSDELNVLKHKQQLKANLWKALRERFISK